jgi:putative ABC transport system permease protein
LNLFTLVWNYLRAKPLNTLLNVLLLGLGVGVITVLVLFKNQLTEKITGTTKGIDLVVGAKGSPLQLILCNIFHIDFPTGNINLKEAERLAKHRLIKQAIPLALGDSYQNFRIVGTTRLYADLYQARLKQGNWWKQDLEVTVGATAAKLIPLKVGDRFASSHGLSKEGHAHEENQYTVVGILETTGSAMDNLILTNVPSIWKVHEENQMTDSISGKTISILLPNSVAIDSTKEITSLLIKYKNPMAAIQLPRLINSQTNMQAASPAFETARLFTLLGVGTDLLMAFAYVLIFISGLSIFIALYNSLKERQYDLAIMRSMGASKSKLVLSVLLEGVIMTFLGAVVGLVFGHGVLLIFTSAVEESARTGFTTFVFYWEEIWIVIGSCVLGILCSLLPAWKAYRTDIHKVLAGR